MRIHLSILSVAVLGASLAAQTQYQDWTREYGSTQWTSRANIGRASGEIHHGVHESHNRGVMSVGTTAEISQFYVVMQDQNCSTRENFDWVVRSGTDATGPDGTTAGELGRIPNLFNHGTDTRTTACAWGLTVTLAPTARIGVPMDKHWDYGVMFNTKSTWTSDGSSVHGRGQLGTHANAEDHAWQLVGTATVANHPSSKRAFRMHCRVADGVTFRLWSGKPSSAGARANFGAGLFPAASTSTSPVAWGARLDGGTGASGAASVVAVGAARIPGAPFGTGSLLFILPAPGALFFGPAADTNGQADVQILPFVPAAASGIGTIHLQGALGLVRGPIRLGNSQAITP